jgi:hypothetical protein
VNHSDPFKKNRLRYLLNFFSAAATIRLAWDLLKEGWIEVMFTGISKLTDPLGLNPFNKRIREGKKDANPAAPGISKRPINKLPLVGMQRNRLFLLQGILKRNFITDHGGSNPCVGKVKSKRCSFEGMISFSGLASFTGSKRIDIPFFRQSVSIHRAIL